MEINRKAVLGALEAVQPGLSAEATVEQSDCFVFKDGRVFTYDDEVACSSDCPMEIEGAVRAKPLLELLQKLPEEVLEVEMGEKELKIKGQRRRSGVRMEEEITLAVNQIEMPGDDDWKDLPDDFCQAIGVVRECVSKDQGAFRLTCVHITPKHVESCDDQQAIRYKLKTGFKQEVLLRSRAVLHLGAMSVVQFAEGESWIHFRSASGLMLSCRRYSEEYIDLNEVLTIDGTKTSLPEGLVTAVDTAKVFSRENVDTTNVEIGLTKNRLVIRGEGPSGWYQEVKRVEYDGDDLMFHISPAMMRNITARSDECCFLSANRLWVDGTKFIYVTALVDKKDSHKEE